MVNNIKMASAGGLSIYWDGWDVFTVANEGGSLSVFFARTGGNPEKALEIAEDRLGELTV